MNRKTIFCSVVCIIICVLFVASLQMPVPNWMRDTISEDIGSHRKIKKRPSDCAWDDLYLKFKNKHSRCVHFDVYDKNGDKYMGQDANDACLNAEMHVCVPPGGHVRAKGTTHCGGRKLRSSVLKYDTIKENHSRGTLGLSLWNSLIGKKKKDLIPIRARCADSYSSFYLNDDKDRYWGDPATRH